jgi:citrate synthase
LHYLQLEFLHFGDLHGGANQAVLEMLEEITRTGGDTDKYLQKPKIKDDPFRWVLVIECTKVSIQEQIIKKADEVLSTLGVTIQFCYCKKN